MTTPNKKRKIVDGTQYNVLRGLDLSIAKGEFVAVMGSSGSGKSTLLNCISCYILFEQGKITLGGTELRNLDETALAKIWKNGGARDLP